MIKPVINNVISNLVKEIMGGSYVPTTNANLIQWLFTSEGFGVLDGQPVVKDAVGGEFRDPQPNRCAEFDGISSSINFGQIDAFNFTSYSFSIFFLFRGDPNTNSSRIIELSSYQINGWEIYLAPGGFIFRCHTAGAVDGIQIVADVFDDQWHKILLIFRSTSVNLYINGVLTNTVAHTLAVPASTTNNIYLGGKTKHPEMKLSNFCVWDRELTTSEIENPLNTADDSLCLWRMDDGSGTNNDNTVIRDSSGQGVSGQVEGATLSNFHAEDSLLPVNAQNKLGYSVDTNGVYIPADVSNPGYDVLGNQLEFSGPCSNPAKLVDSACLTSAGVSEYIDFGNDASLLPDAWTISAWVKPTSTSSVGLISFAGIANTCYIVLNYFSVNQPRLYLGPVCYIKFNASAWTTLSDGNWHYVSFTCPGAEASDINNVEMYIDAVAQTKDSTTVGSQAVKTNFILHGRQGCPFKGSICGFSMHNRVLSLSEIQAQMLGTISTVDIVDYWPLQEKAGEIVCGVNGNDGQMNNFTLSSAWEETQDAYHDHIMRGYSRYLHATDPMMYVSYGLDGNPLSIIPQTGYALDGHNTAGNFHNGARTKIQQYQSAKMIQADQSSTTDPDYWFDSDGIANKISYAGIVPNVDDFVFANVSANQKRDVMTYDVAQVSPELGLIGNYVATTSPDPWIIPTDIAYQDWQSLFRLYQDTNGGNWTNDTGWLTADLAADYYGVTVLDAAVSQLSLHSNQLSGSIPTELGQLTNLAGLSLYSNQLSGSIPTELGQLTSLSQWLFLHDNQLSGSIPTELGQLTSLSQLSLHSNQLSGFIPTELGQLTNLAGLSLHDNQLSGSIPTELGQLTSLSWLYLHSNQFTGAEMSNFVIDVLWVNRVTLGANSFITDITTAESLSVDAIDAIDGTDNGGSGLYLDDGLTQAGCTVTATKS